MASYRQHLAFATVLGAAYGAGLWAWQGVHWLYGSVAAVLSCLGGLLPDLDSPTGVELRTFTALMGAMAAVGTWTGIEAVAPELPFEARVWAMIGAFALVRYGLRAAAGRLTVHRGLSHSPPAALAWSALVYVAYPSELHEVRLAMAGGMLAGFASHLLLDEVSSVDLGGLRIKRSAGSTLKLWSRSPWATLALYGILSILAWRVLEIWPDQAPPFGAGPIDARALASAAPWPWR